MTGPLARIDSDDIDAMQTSPNQSGEDVAVVIPFFQRTPGILAQVTAAYSRYGINIDGVLQLPRFRKDRLPFVTTLEECAESMLDQALADVAKSDYHVQPPLALPIFV